MDDRRVAGRDVEDLEVAAEVIAIRHEVGLRRHVMRTLLNAARSTTVSLCAQTNSPTYTVSGSVTSVSCTRRERVAEVRDGHDVRRRRAARAG